MDSAQLTALKDRLEAAAALDEALAADVVAMIGDGLAGKLDAADALAGLLGSAESALRVIGHLHPGWAVSLDGHASPRDNAKWRCKLSETQGPDDDQIVGIGNAGSMQLAMLSALVHIKTMRAAGYR